MGKTTAQQTILVIEDDNGLRRMMTGALQGEGYHVLDTDNGKDGIAAATSQAPDLIVLDLMLPEKSGIDIVAELKADSRFANIPVVIITCLTENSGQDDEHWRKRIKADDFISKPFPVAELIRRVHKHLD